jgi:hypothetical protein
VILSLCLVECVCVNRPEQDDESKAELNKAFAELEEECKGHEHVMQQCKGHEYGIALMTMNTMLRMIIQNPNELKYRSLPPELCSIRVLPHPLLLLAAGQSGQIFHFGMPT